MNFYLFNFVGNSASSWVSSILSLASLILTGVIACFVYDYTHKRWINDVYARQEASLWLEYRSKIFDLIDYLRQFNFNDNDNKLSFDCVIDDKLYELINSLIKLHKILEPFYIIEFSEEIYKERLEFFEQRIGFFSIILRGAVLIKKISIEEYKAVGGIRYKYTFEEKEKFDAHFNNINEYNNILSKIINDLNTKITAHLKNR